MRTLFILNLVAALALCDVSAGSEVGSTAEFESAWNSAVSGSTISLSAGASITLSGASLTPLSGATLSGQTGATLIAAPELHLNGSTVRNVQFANSVAGAESVLSISGVCSFSDVQVSGTKVNAAAVQVASGATLNVNSGSSFINNISAGNAGAIDVAEDGVLKLSAEAGKNIRFEGNYAAQSLPADVYLAKDATMKLNTSADSQISFGSGVASASGASIEKTGEGEVFLGDGSFYSGDVKVSEGKVVMSGGSSWAGRQFEVLGNGTLELNEGALLSAGTISLQGTTLVAGNASLGSIDESCDISLGGNLTIGVDSCLTAIGSLTLASNLTLNVSGYSLAEGTSQSKYCLIDTWDATSLVSSSLSWKINGDGGYRYSVSVEDGDVYLVVQQSRDSLVWAWEKKTVWSVGSGGWQDGKAFSNNDEVSFSGKGTVTIEGRVSPSSITVNVDKSLTFKSNKKKPGSLAGDGRLTKKGKGTLTLNDGNSTWTGDTYLESGTIKVKGTSSLGKGDVYLNGGTLNLSSKAISNDIIQEGNAAIKSGKKFTGTYTLESGELQKGSTINVTRTATLSGGTVNGTLSGSGKVLVDGEVKMGDKGKITANNLTVEADAVLKTSSKGLVMGKSSNINMGEMALLHSYGKVSANNLSMNGSGFYAYESAKASSVSIKGNMSLKNGSVAAVKGKLTVSNLSMDNSRLYMDPYEATATVQKITVKGNTTLTNASEIMTDKLTTGSLTLKDSTLRLTGSKPQSLTVKGVLSINSGSCIIMDYDFVQGKTYKLITCKSFSYSGSLYDLFGVSEEDCLLERKGNAITLTVTDKWYQQFETEEEAVAQKAVATSATEQPAISAAAAETNPVVDALVQSNWGQLEASRAFVNAMANRSMAVQLGNGERAVWASAIGASSRHSSANGHAGADTNVTGGAFGLETQVGRASLFGMALGNSWTRVSAHGFGTIEQDTTHLGLYGQTNWRSGVTADWSAAYGRSDSETMGSDWSQKNVQLDGRVSYNHELNANTLLSPFAGLQYYASDSATVDGTNTGSLQNLRAEIGVAASRRMGKFGVYGEIALHQDIARNNPKVEMEGVRYNGMNPGRTGINFTVGASYELNDKWSVNASYTGEFVENANAHSANMGATYKF